MDIYKAELLYKDVWRKRFLLPSMNITKKILFVLAITHVCPKKHLSKYIAKEVL